ncbi:MAG TPA: polysaccharide deacetylase family protein [Steroidobacteraceae bacterium]|nr:polysaccharide deacetylase family protein [Steroidobacteraceae bacterium]
MHWDRAIVAAALAYPGHARVSAGVKTTIKTICGRAAGVSGAYRRKFRTVMTVVAFHRVNDELPEDDPLTCGARKFESFCRFFRKYFRVVPLSEQIAGCQAQADLGGTLSITFDDGYLDNYEVAAPILRNLGLPATFFVTTGFIGSRTVAPWDRQLRRQPGWMSWEQVRGLAASGFEIGNHTDTHVDLGTADAATIRTEFETSKRKLAEALGVSAPLFAYPFGGREHISPSAVQLAREAGFVCCASCFGGENGVTPDPFSLKRVPIAGWFRTPDQFGFEFVIGKAAAAELRGGGAHPADAR